MIPKNRIPTHPGVILSQEFLVPLGVTQVAFAAHLGVPVQRINELVRGSAASRPRPRGCSRRLSTPRRSSGLTCRRPMISLGVAPPSRWNGSQRSAEASRATKRIDPDSAPREVSLLRGRFRARCSSSAQRGQASQQCRPFA